MPRAVSTTAAPAQPTVQQEARFVFQANDGHVKVTASDRRLGMPQLMEAMARDPKLHNCVIEQCAFDGDLFTARLRLEK